MFIPRRSTTAISRNFAKGRRRTSPLPSAFLCTEEATYTPFGRFAVKTKEPELERAVEDREGAATEEPAAAVVAPPPPPLLDLRVKQQRNRREEEAEFRREVRYAGARPVAEAAVARVHGGPSRLTYLRRRYKAECAFGEGECLYWEMHDRGIAWKCSSMYLSE